MHLLEAGKLVQKDNFLGAIRGKSDPYAFLRVGLVQFRSKTVQRNLNPVWNETFEVVPTYNAYLVIGPVPLVA